MNPVPPSSASAYNATPRPILQASPQPTPKPSVLSAAEQIPLFESNLRLLQALDLYAKSTWIPEIEERIRKLSDHTERTKQLDALQSELISKGLIIENKEKDLAARETALANDRARMEDENRQNLARQQQALAEANQKLGIERDNLAKVNAALAAREQEVSRREAKITEGVTKMLCGETMTLPTAFRSDSPAAVLSEWFTPKAEPVSIERLKVALQAMGIAEDLRSKELYVFTAIECFRFAKEIERQAGGEQTKKMAEKLKKNIFGFSFRIPQIGQPVDPLWVVGPQGSVTSVESWAIFDSSNVCIKHAVVK